MSDEKSFQNIVVLDESYHDWNAITSTISRQADQLVDPSEFVSAIFVHSQESKALQATHNKMEIIAPGKVKKMNSISTNALDQQMTTIASISEEVLRASKSRSPVIIAYDSLEQVIDVLRKSGERVNALSLLGFTNSEMTKYLQSFIPHRICGVDLIPMPVPFGVIRRLPPYLKVMITK